jgi:Tfp pilus assembly protein PilO
VKQLLEKERGIDQKIQKIHIIRNKQNELADQLTKLKASNGEAISELKKMIPDDMENARLINYIQSIKSNSNGTLITDIKIDSGDQEQRNKKGKIVINKKKDYKSVIISFSFIGKYNDFTKFLDDLYKSLRLADVVSVEVTKDKSNTKDLNTDKLKFNFKIRTY